MSKISIKKDFKNGDTLYDVDLNNNFSVIEAGVNANEENLDNVIKDAELRLQKELEDITADRGWDWNGGNRVTFFKGSATEVEAQPIKDGQLLYNTETGETALDDTGSRIVTGSGNVVVVSEEEPTNIATKEWIKPSKMVSPQASFVVDTMNGQSTTQSPSVHAVKDYIDNENFQTKGTLLWTNPNPTSSFSAQTITLSDSISNYDFYEVIYSEYAGNDPYGSSGRIPTSQLTNIGQVANMFVRRGVTALSGTSMTFGDGQQCTAFNGSWTSQNQRIVPVYVIGYKTGMFD